MDDRPFFAGGKPNLPIETGSAEQRPLSKLSLGFDIGPPTTHCPVTINCLLADPTKFASSNTFFCRSSKNLIRKCRQYRAIVEISRRFETFVEEPPNWLAIATWGVAIRRDARSRPLSDSARRKPIQQVSHEHPGGSIILSGKRSDVGRHDVTMTSNQTKRSMGGAESKRPDSRLITTKDG
jgi:hypothetical protein